MHWKIARDPYLRPLAERRGESAVWDAGFFFDDDPDDAPLDDIDWWCTPLPRRRTSGGRPAVLLATGAFCPVHEGHLAMMERAREAATRAGYDVLAGYLSPGHDAYIRMKCGAAAIPASERLRRCAEAARPSGWMLTDPWEALHRRVSVNFTDVAARLERYLRAHVYPRLEVLYVCGGDNARFALAFTERGGCVVVGRPGAEPEYARWRAALSDHPRIVWAEGDHPAASRTLRKAVWEGPRERRLVLRREDDRAVRTLGIRGYAHFVDGLCALLRERVTLRTVPLGVATDDPREISLDAMLPAAHTLAMSRRYALGGYDALDHVARPGAPSLAAQRAKIPAGRYVLRDDDRMTGGTLDAARALLGDAVVIDETRVSVAHDEGEDVADARDFLLGADEGGLVVALPGDVAGRAPYVLPYVDPAVRCCVPPDAVRAFSRDVWTLQAQTFAGTGLRVRDLPPAARAVVGFLGDDAALDDVCRWHAARLSG